MVQWRPTFVTDMPAAGMHVWGGGHAGAQEQYIRHTWQQGTARPQAAHAEFCKVPAQTRSWKTGDSGERISMGAVGIKV